MSKLPSTTFSDKGGRGFGREISPYDERLHKGMPVAASHWKDDPLTEERKAAPKVNTPKAAVKKEPKKKPGPQKKDVSIQLVKPFKEQIVYQKSFEENQIV